MKFTKSHLRLRVRAATAVVAAVILSSSCSVYQSSDRNDFNSNALSGAPKSTSKRISGNESVSEPKCALVENSTDAQLAPWFTSLDDDHTLMQQDFAVHSDSRPESRPDSRTDSRISPHALEIVRCRATITSRPNVEVLNSKQVELWSEQLRQAAERLSL